MNSHSPLTLESPFSPIFIFHMSLPMLHILLSLPLSSALEPVVLISTLAIPVFDIPKPLQPQVTKATPSTLSIMAHLDTLQELFVSMDSRIDAHLSKMETRMDDLTFSIQQLTSMVIGSGSDTRAPTVAHETMPILQTSGDDGGEAVTPILEITNQVTTPMLEDIDQVATLVLEEIDGVLDPIIGT
ncbi:hypothetical protein AAG906_038490 [Vitis piasezkii]